LAKHRLARDRQNHRPGTERTSHKPSPLLRYLGDVFRLLTIVSYFALHSIDKAMNVPENDAGCIFK